MNSGQHLTKDVRSPQAHAPPSQNDKPADQKDGVALYVEVQTQAYRALKQTTVYAVDEQRFIFKMATSLVY